MKKAFVFVVMLCAAAGFSQTLFKGNEMHKAVAGCNYETVRNLILKTNDATLWAWLSGPKSRDGYNRTQLYNLLRCDNFEGVKILNALIVLNETKKLGMEFDKTYDTDNATPFYTFAEDGNLTMVKVFADKNFQKEMNDVLKSAQTDNYDSLLKPSLNKLSPDINAQNRWGYSPAAAVADRIKDDNFKDRREKYINILGVISAAGGKAAPSAPSKNFFQMPKAKKAGVMAMMEPTAKQLGFDRINSAL